MNDRFTIQRLPIEAATFAALKTNYRVLEVDRLPGELFRLATKLAERDLPRDCTTDFILIDLGFIALIQKCRATLRSLVVHGGMQSETQTAIHAINGAISDAVVNYEQDLSMEETLRRFRAQLAPLLAATTA